MYWSWKNKRDGISYISWGQPKSMPPQDVENPTPRYDVKVYSGEAIKPGETIVFMMQGDSTLGLGDSIWLVSYIRELYRIKARRQARMCVVSSPWILDFYSNFIPPSFVKIPEYMKEEDFWKCEHKLPAMYYWHDTNDQSDKSWVDNRSLLKRLFAWSGMEYNGLPDWGEFTNPSLLYPPAEFWKFVGISPGERYVYYQWHSSGHSKNLPVASNIKLIRHIIKQYGVKVCVIGRLKSLDAIEGIPGVVNMSGKTEGRAEALITLAFNSEFIVSPDSAGVHLAEAYRIPAVGIMATLPPSYIACDYKIPAFMFGSGHCPYKPCGVVWHLPKDRKCPPGTGDYCKVLEDIDLNLFDKCVAKSFQNRSRMGSAPAEDFYEALSAPISMGRL